MDTLNQNNNSSQNQDFLKQMEAFFDTYLHKKAPFHLPPKVKEFIVHYGPWITLVVMILALPGILFGLGFMAFYAPFAMMSRGFGGSLLLESLITLAALVLEVLALPGLFARSLKGWHLLYYAVLVNAVARLLGGDILGMIIGTVIALFLLFEIREYYK
jgi:hypothetical protein